jgi:trehalose-phosphatase
VESFIAANHRLIITDLIGTLAAKAPGPGDACAHLSGRIIDAITALSSDPNTTVVVITRCSRDTCECLADTGAWLVAEDGYFLRQPEPDMIDAPWETVHKNLDLSWKEEIYNMVLHTQARTPGSKLITTETSIEWHYGDCNPHFARSQANDLMGLLLGGALANTSAEAFDSNKVVRIAPRGVNKLSAVKHVVMLLDRKLAAQRRHEAERSQVQSPVLHSARIRNGGANDIPEVSLGASAFPPTVRTAGDSDLEGPNPLTPYPTTPLSCRNVLAPNSRSIVPLSPAQASISSSPPTPGRPVPSPSGSRLRMPSSPDIRPRSTLGRNRERNGSGLELNEKKARDCVLVISSFARSDEDLFGLMREVGEKGYGALASADATEELRAPEHESPNVVTCVVGARKKTRANYFVPSPEDVENLLSQLQETLVPPVL